MLSHLNLFLRLVCMGIAQSQNCATKMSKRLLESLLKPSSCRFENAETDRGFTSGGEPGSQST